MLKMLWLSVLWFAVVGAVEPLALYLSWVGDPGTTMVVQWHTGEDDAVSRVFYQKKGDKEWSQAEGNSWVVGGVASRVHAAELKGLEPDTEYAFKVAEKVHLFRTMPSELTRPVKFAVGGDLFHETEVDFQRMNQAVAKQDPDFVVMGGDLAYTRSAKDPNKTKEWQKARWDLFFWHCQNELVGKDGRMIPMVVVVGNHDVVRFEPSDMFYEIFMFPERGKSYRTLEFGKYLSLVLLDSAHTYPVEGEQTNWLEKMLSERADMLYLFPVYHVAAYPAYYPLNQKTASLIRQFWVPLFEKYGVQVVFEHHNHVFKRTRPIRGNEVHPDGIVYLGDGSWGITPRVPKLKDKWYISNAQQANAVYLVTLEANGATIAPMTNDGEKIDIAITLEPQSLAIK